MSTDHETSGDEIALCVIQAYNRLPQKFKPIRKSTTTREWVPLSGIVLSGGRDAVITPKKDKIAEFDP